MDIYYGCSDDSDQEISNELDADKKEVLDFLSTATISELRVMPQCSQKKAEAIIEQRPFNSWKDLVRTVCFNLTLTCNWLEGLQCWDQSLLGTRC